jgi:hypothetical protein
MGQFFFDSIDTIDYTLDSLERCARGDGVYDEKAFSVTESQQSPNVKRTVSTDREAPYTPLNCQRTGRTVYNVMLTLTRGVQHFQQTWLTIDYPLLPVTIFYRRIVMLNISSHFLSFLYALTYLYERRHCELDDQLISLSYPVALTCTVRAVLPTPPSPMTVNLNIILGLDYLSTT